jgi:hypothetical protein
MLGVTALGPPCACDAKPRRGPPAALSGADVCRDARGDCADCHCVPSRRRPVEDWSAFRRLFKPLRHDQRSFVVVKKEGTHAGTHDGRTHNLTFSLKADSAESPCGVEAFVVNSESHTGACPSVRLCVELITCIHFLDVRDRVL